MAWLKRKLFGEKISISIIGVGNAGCRIGNLLIRSLQENKINLKSLAINQTNDFQEDIGSFGDKLWFEDIKQPQSYGKLEMIESLMNEKIGELKDKLSKVVFYKKEDQQEENALHLIVASGGATGSTGSIITSKLIREITGSSPTVLFIVPEKHETSLVQYNAAKALHYLGFDGRGPQSPILLFDNEKLLTFFIDEPISQALKKSNQLLVETFTTTILAALQESTHEEYNASLDDFFESFGKDAKGLGVIVALDREFESMKKAGNVRFSDIFFSELEETSSLTADVTKAKRGFLTITAPISYQITFETKKIVKRFEKGSVKVALTSFEEPILSIRGVITGIHPDFVERFWDILDRGKNARKEIIIKEDRLNRTKIDVK